jgi:ethanolamine utilization microcompartment shell protein EutS
VVYSWKFLFYREGLMDFQIIKKPSSSVIRMLESRSYVKDLFKQKAFDTIGLVQGKLSEMFVAADIAEKASGVEVLEIKGICPQHFSMIAIFGDTAAVEEALDRIKTQFERG